MVQNVSCGEEEEKDDKVIDDTDDMQSRVEMLSDVERFINLSTL